MATSYIRSATIGPEREAFLNAHPEIRFPELARAAIDREMKRIAKQEA
jgi:hypothetical protein